MNQSDIYHNEQENAESSSIDHLASTFAPDRVNIAKAIASLKSSLDEGEIHPLSLAVRIKWVEEWAAEAKEVSRPHILTAVGQYAKGEEIAKYGSRIEPMEAGAKYNYSNCVDPIWDALNQKMDQIKSEMKNREMFLKAIKEITTIIDDETGEIYTIFPPTKTSTSTYKVTLKK